MPGGSEEKGEVEWAISAPKGKDYVIYGSGYCLFSLQRLIGC